LHLFIHRIKTPSIPVLIAYNPLGPISLVQAYSHPAKVLRKIIHLPYCILIGIHLKYHRNSVKYDKPGNFAQDELHSIISRFIPAIYACDRQLASEKLPAPACLNSRVSN
jgi:hypothetical protein